MKLVDEIIDLAVDDKGSISVVLRKCLVLAHDLKNERLRGWAENELNGYDREGDIPPYRKIGAVAKGHFLGPFGAQISSQPLPSFILKPEHRHFAESVKLTQPIVAYEQSVGPERGNNSAILEWPANLTVMYQSKFIDGYGLNRAWQEIPSSVFPGLIDTIRTRILRLALELKDGLEQVSDNPAEIPREKVDQFVTNYIFGGTTVIAGSAHDFTQFGNIMVSRGDLPGLATFLSTLGVADVDLVELKAALSEDAGNRTDKSLGQRTAAWIKGIGAKLGNAGVTVGVDVVTAAATKAIMQFLGLS